ncbi:M23 family metallopeptidase [Microbacterium sp. BWT-B31]|uniref:murein hydrolase activator EnvC family protein n=1 Tax=Microbacterium sp. BWT-B31 TaxID=3232072 RepID=UPI003528CABF
MRSPHRRLALSVVFALATLATLSPSTPPTAAADEPVPPPAAPRIETSQAWLWPLGRFRLVEPYVAPAHRYGPGHRGIDLEPVDSTVVRAPASGVVAFSGMVAGRGVLTIDHGDGLVTTLEPVDSTLPIATLVARGDEVATVAIGGHTRPGALHFGVRLDGEYINPMLLLGGVPRAVLLPCC